MTELQGDQIILLLQNIDTTFYSVEKLLQIYFPVLLFVVALLKFGGAKR